jgi:dGTPase
VENYSVTLRELYRENGVTGQTDFDEVYFNLDFDRNVAPAIGYGNEFAQSDSKLQTFLRDRVLNSFHAQRMDGVGRYVIRNLAEAYMANPQQLPDKIVGALIIDMDGVPLEPREPRTFGEFRERVKSAHNSSANSQFQISLLRTICDHIAGMTDRYAFEEYQQLYGSAALRTFDAM